VNAVTGEQTAGVAKKYLVPDKLVVVAVGDRSKIESGLKELNLGRLEVWDAEGKPVN
jgi:zinc protease